MSPIRQPVGGNTVPRSEVGSVAALGVKRIPSILGDAPPSQSLPTPAVGITGGLAPPAWFPIPVATVSSAPVTGGIPTIINMMRAETAPPPVGQQAPPMAAPMPPMAAPVQPVQTALNPWAVWNPAVHSAMSSAQPMRWSGSRKDWPQFKLDWKRWERMGESTGVIPNEVKFNCFRNAVDEGTKEALAAALEADPAMTFQQWWDRLDATYGGDSLQTAWAEWVNHHLVVEGATLTLPAWRVFEGKFYKLRNRVPTISEF